MIKSTQGLSGGPFNRAVGEGSQGRLRVVIFSASEWPDFSIDETNKKRKGKEKERETR